MAARTVKLTDARARLSPLVSNIDALGAVALTVRGKVKAYLVSPRELEARRSALGGTKSVRRPIRGTLEILGDLAAGSRRAARQFEQAARRSAHELRR